MENRVRRNTFILYGAWALVMVAIVLAWYFIFLRPQQETRAQVQQKLQDQRAIAGRQVRAVEEQRKAQDRLSQLNGQLQFFRKRYRILYFGEMGSDYASADPIQRANREAAWRNWMNTYYSGLGPSLSQELISVADATGVEISTSVLIEAPPKAPEEVVAPPNGLLKPVSGGAAAGGAASSATASGGATAATGGSINVSVTGSLSNLLTYFSRLNTTQTLMTVGSVKLETVSAVPTRIRASFTATPYLLAAGPGAVPAVSVLTGATASGVTPLPVPSAATTTTTAGVPAAVNNATG